MGELDNLLDITKRRLDAAWFAWKSTGCIVSSEDEFFALFSVINKLERCIYKMMEGEDE